MNQIILTAIKRNTFGKSVNKLRKASALPGVVYGHGFQTTSVEINEKEFKKAFKQAGENTLVSLQMEGKTIPVIIHDVQTHYLNDKPIHVDFYAVRMDEKLKARIPIHFVGESGAVKALGGILVKNLSDVEVECLPSDLPQFFEVDISRLENFDQAIRVSDLNVPEKVKVLANPDEVVVNVTAPRSEEELKALETEVKEDVLAVEGVVKPETEIKAEDEEGPMGKEGKSPEAAALGNEKGSKFLGGKEGKNPKQE